MSHRILRTIAIFGVCGVAACKDVSDPGGTPTTIEVATAAPASGVVNSAVTPGPAFVVKNENGAAMAATVTVAVTAGGGTLTGQPAKSSVGTTSIGTWTLGKTAGTNTVTVTVGSLTPVKFDVTGTPASPNKVIEINPPAVLRTALANATVSSPVVAVADSFGNAIAGQPVTFSIFGGGGTLTGSLTATTDATGQATAPTWRLGKSADGAGAQKLRAASGSTLPLDISATVQTSYSIVVRFFNASTMTAEQQAVFTAAAQRIMGMVTGDLANVQFAAPNNDVSACLGQPAGTTVLNETVDDIVVYATAKSIDGVGNILGSAGPCYIRQGTGCGVGCDKIPVMGVMSFDSADLNKMTTDGSLLDVITHEMLHVLGVGSLWGSEYFNFVTGAGTLDPRYTAAQARTACVAVGGTVSCASTVPLEGCATRPSCQPPNGGGTRDSHWRDANFGTELMTGFISPGASHPVSAITVASLQDLGYVVNTGDSDAYTIASGSIMASVLRAPAPSAFPENWEGLHRAPLYSIDLGGTVRLLRKAQ